MSTILISKNLLILHDSLNTLPFALAPFLLLPFVLNQLNQSRILYHPYIWNGTTNTNVYFFSSLSEYFTLFDKPCVTSPKWSKLFLSSNIPNKKLHTSCFTQCSSNLVENKEKLWISIENIVVFAIFYILFHSWIQLLSLYSNIDLI